MIDDNATCTEIVIDRAHYPQPEIFYGCIRCLDPPKPIPQRSSGLATIGESLRGQFGKVRPRSGRQTRQG